MKRLRLLPAAMCLLGTILMTACSLDSDNKYKLTDADEATLRAQMRGTYTGYLYSYNVEDSTKTDTTLMSWTVDDSLVVIKNFPTKYLADVISDSVVAKEVAKLDPQTINCRYGFYSKEPVYYILNPYLNALTVNYGGADHKVYVGFYCNSTNSFGIFNTTSYQMTMQIVEGGVYVDSVDSNNNLVKEGNPFIFTGKK